MLAFSNGNGCFHTDQIRRDCSEIIMWVGGVSIKQISVPSPPGIQLNLVTPLPEFWPNIGTLSLIFENFNILQVHNMRTNFCVGILRLGHLSKLNTGTYNFFSEFCQIYHQGFGQISALPLQSLPLATSHQPQITDKFWFGLVEYFSNSIHFAIPIIQNL